MGKLPVSPAPAPALRRPSELPEHARLLALESVWMEGDAISQLARAAAMPDCVAAVGMPDLHAGPGIPIGVALAFSETVHPHLVGGDAGCGARVITVGKLKVRGDQLERRVREHFARPILGELIDVDELDPLELLEAVWRGGSRALARLRVDDELAAFAEQEPELDGLPASPALPEFLAAPELADALGTIGGGNHFVELGQVGELVDKDAASAIGVDRRGYAILAHSGSRGLGRMLAAHWGMQALTDADAQQQYLGQLAGAIRFAQANRLLLAWRMLEACGAARLSRIDGGFDLVHNFVAREAVSRASPPPPSAASRPPVEPCHPGYADSSWLHRKGCAPARLGEPAVVLGSRGTPSWLMRGCGNAACLCSVAHGAGRRMTRSEARAKIALRHKRASLGRTATGRVICDDKDLLYEEHPDAYKSISPVIDSLEQAGAATRVASLEPLVTVKIR
ncbi:MAG TPA: RtcB family protein [Enhygromyxa sp.]|nr:RtcB family protein [Enhygromyxa sp.]